MRRWVKTAAALALAASFSAELSAEPIPRLDGTWVVDSYTFRPISAMDAEGADAYLGRTQYFEKGFAEGPFFNCDFEGLSLSYKIRDVAGFMQDPDNIPYAEAGLSGGQFLEHDIACEKNGDRLTMLTSENAMEAFIGFDGVIFHLNYAEQ